MKKGISIVLALVLVTGCLAGSVCAAGASFTDVKESDYFYNPVQWAVENGVTSGMGDNRFGPLHPCTRGQVVTFLWRAAGSPSPSSDSNPFVDVGTDDYFYTPVLWAVENGITAGVGANRFGPNQTCTRAQIVTFLWKSQNAPEPSNPNAGFSDVDVSAYYAESVAWAVENSVTAGMGNNQFAPEATCTRGQVMTFLYKTANPDAVIPMPPVIDEPQIRTIVYGTSGAGRKLTAYRYGTGRNVLVVTFAIHGWEDGFSRDGQLLVDTAHKLRALLQSQFDMLVKRGDWSVYVFPTLNPDGLADGWTHNGPGRCTTYSLNEGGELVYGRGVDMNRCFPYNFVPSYSGRNYTGDRPLQSVEAKALHDYIQCCRGTGHNVLIDVHGWFDQIICSTDRSGQVYRALQNAFPSGDYTTLRGGRGYFAAWAGYTQGFESCLFEFPYISNAQQFYDRKYDQRFIEAVCDILTTYH